MRKLKLMGFLLLPAIVLPAALSLSSCTGDLSHSFYDISNQRDGAIGENASYDSFKTSDTSLHSLLWGNKNFHHGNYVVMITHSYFDAVNGIIGISNNYQGGFLKENKPDLKINSTSNSVVRAISEMNDDYYWDNVDMGFVIIIEEDIRVNWDVNHPNGPYEEDKPCTPYSQWTDEDHERNEDHKTGDYVRNDNDATGYRSLTGELTKLFSGATNNDLFMMQWTKGYPIADNLGTSDTTKNINSFLQWLRTNYDKGKDWK